DRAGVPQVPRGRRPLDPGAHHRLGAHDDGARVPRPAPAGPGLRRLFRARQAAVGYPGAGADAAARPVPPRCGGGQVRARGEREKLADSIDVAVYTAGRASGRPISITLLPNGINELPDQEQQLLANLSAAALGDMLHLKNSATHQKQSGTLSVALRILGGRFSKEVTLADLINLLEEEDPELSDLTQRMDPSGRIRRDLVAQLDSLRHRNSSLFEAGGEPLRMEALLGSGRYGRRDGRTRLSIIYTGFLGDNENIL